MKLDRKKDFKKKLVTCFSLLQVSDPIKVIVDETFIHLCIVHKIPIKEELAKLVNRQLILMTTRCISTSAKKTHNEETAYGIRKITHYKCNHNGDNVRCSLDMFLKKMNNERNSPFSVKKFFENEVSVTHNFDSVCNVRGHPGEGKASKGEEAPKVEEATEEEAPKRDDTPKGEGPQTAEAQNDGETEWQVELSDSMKCIIDLVKNNNEKKFFVATNNNELRSFLRKVFLVPIIYISEGGAVKMESLSTKNTNRKAIVELRKMKMLKWERELRMSEQKKNKDKVKKNGKKKKQAKGRNGR
ncbi:hypothetical protein C922_00797 [Plasmodium inui San Antonio 1]|uniref:PIN domain-containing protein n=1 Tax=Plasmodium inui San Antonio 1 TaxID=1237626 RepID=W7ABP6_9APIC|nr:hypothetical protein C922_00797 [Plasmodium inui San Antonio 1]EUD69105.1 hypothetical protein C922_00797 [Plasmodium inui San Antonio 1]